jgi:hypothetical protein
VTEMKESFDQLHRIGFGYPENVQVHLINRSLSRDFAGFVQNFNMHCSGKTVSELLALLVDYEKSLPAKVKALCNTPKIPQRKTVSLGCYFIIQSTSYRKRPLNETF